MCHAVAEIPKTSLLENGLPLEPKETLTASGRLVGNPIVLKKCSSSELTLGECSDTKVIGVKHQLSGANFKESTSKRSFKLKLVTWVFKPFVLCAEGVKTVILAICRAVKATVSFIFGSRYTAEIQDWKNAQRYTRSLSEGSFDALTKTRGLPFRPIISAKTTFENLPEVAASEIRIVNGLKYSAFALSTEAEPTPVKRIVPLPLYNIGNSCYLNSFIQTLYNSQDLCELVRQPIIKSDNIDDKGFKLLESYQNAWVRILDVYDYISRCGDPVQKYRFEVALEGELYSLRNWIFTGQNKEEDPQIISTLENHPFHQELVLAKIPNPIGYQHDPANLFEGLFDLLSLNVLSKTERRAIYNEQLYTSESKAEPLSRLIHCCCLPMKKTSLQYLLEQQFFEQKRDPENAYHLDLGNGTSVFVPNYNTHTILLGEPPKTLALHLKRFDSETIGKKNESLVELPDDGIVDLSKAFQSLGVSYKITSCIAHGSNGKSTIYSGHYTSYVKCEEDWYFCDDHKPVRKLNWDEVRKEVATSSYIFTLEKVECSVGTVAGA